MSLFRGGPAKSQGDVYRVGYENGVATLPRFGIRWDTDDWSDRGHEVVSWGRMEKTLRSYVKAVTGAGRKIPDDVAVPVVLIPRPDNTADPGAISIAAPAEFGGDVDDRLLGYVRSKVAYRLGEAKVPLLARYSNWEVACTAIYAHGGLRLDLPWSDTLGPAIEEVIGTAGPVPTPPAAKFSVPFTSKVLAEVGKHRGRTRAVGGIRLATVHGRDRGKALGGELIPTRIAVTDGGTGEHVGAWVDGILVLEDERRRERCLGLLRSEGVAVHEPRGTSSEGIPNLRARWVVGGLRILAPRPAHEDAFHFWGVDRAAERGLGMIARYNTRTGFLWIQDAPFEQVCRTYLERLGLQVRRIEQAPWPWHLDEFVDAAVTRDATCPGPTNFRRPNVLETLREVVPEDLFTDRQIAWSDEPSVRELSSEHLLTYEKYVAERVALFPNSTLTGTTGVCRLCWADAGEFRVPYCQEPLGYCQTCLLAAARGLEGERDAAAKALGLIGELEFDGHPLLESQLDTVHIDPTSTVAAEDVDRLVLLRFAIQRGAWAWTHLLVDAGLVDEGLRMARGTLLPARDGHLCLSLREKVVDDFFHQHRIEHEREPHYPHDAAINPRTRFRADWVLADGTLVELWGLPDDPRYAARMEEKHAIAAKNGIRLIGLVDADLPRLPQVFAEWLPDGASTWRWSELTASEPRVPRVKGESRPDPDAPGGGVYHVEQRQARLERCRRAVRLRDDGLTRREIGEELGYGVEAVKGLLRDGTFYADPHADPVRRERASAAHQAMAAGLTKADFRREHNLSTPKVNEAWRDADVLFGHSRRTNGGNEPAPSQRN